MTNVNTYLNRTLTTRTKGNTKMTEDIISTKLNLYNVDLGYDEEEFLEDLFNKLSDVNQELVLLDFKELDRWLEDNTRFERVSIVEVKKNSNRYDFFITGAAEPDTGCISVHYTELMRTIKCFTSNKRFIYYLTKEWNTFNEYENKINPDKETEGLLFSHTELIIELLSRIRFIDRHKAVETLIGFTDRLLKLTKKSRIQEFNIEDNGKESLLLKYKCKGEGYRVNLKTNFNEPLNVIKELEDFFTMTSKKRKPAPKSNKAKKELEETKVVDENKEVVEEDKPTPIVLTPGNISFSPTLLATTKLEVDEVEEKPTTETKDAFTPFQLVPTPEEAKAIENKEEPVNTSEEEDTNKTELEQVKEVSTVSNESYTEEVKELAKLFESYPVTFLPNKLEFINSLLLKSDKETITNISTMFLHGDALPNLTLGFSNNTNVINITANNFDDKEIETSVNVARLFSFLVMILGAPKYREALVEETIKIKEIKETLEPMEHGFRKLLTNSALTIHPFLKFKDRGKELSEVVEQLDLIDIRLAEIPNLEIAAEYRSEEGYIVTIRDNDNGKHNELIVNPKHLNSGLKGVIKFLENYKPEVKEEDKEETKDKPKRKKPLELKPSPNDTVVPILDESNRNVPIAREVTPNRKDPNPLPISDFSNKRVVGSVISSTQTNEVNGLSARRDYFSLILDLIKERINKWHKNNIEGNPMHISDKLTIKLGDLSNALIDDLEEELKHSGFSSDFVRVETEDYCYVKLTIKPAFGFY